MQNEGVITVVEDMAEDRGIDLLIFSSRRKENLLLLDNDLLMLVRDDEVADYDNDTKITIDEVCSNSGEEWDEDELQQAISDMKSDHVVMNGIEDVDDQDKSDELVKGDDEIGEVDKMRIIVTRL